MTERVAGEDLEDAAGRLPMEPSRPVGEGEVRVVGTAHVSHESVAEVVIEGRDIDRAVTAADMVSDHIALGVDADEEYFYVDAEGDTDDVHLELTRADLIDLVAGPAHSLFSLDYLKDMNKAIPKDAEVTMELGEEFPVKMHFDIAEGKGSVTYLLAPRIQSD